jgi:hypothetical protein
MKDERPLMKLKRPGVKPGRSHFPIAVRYRCATSQKNSGTVVAPVQLALWIWAMYDPLFS